MNFFVIRILGKYFTSDQWANFIVKETADFGRKMFEDSHFQRLAKIDGANIDESNRVFNETQVTGLVYAMLFVEQERKYLKEDRADFWQKVATKIPQSFYIWLRELNLDSECVDTWNKLIHLRLDEYQEGIVEMKKIYERQAPDNIRKDVKEFFYCLDAVALGAALHISEGKMMPNDPLRKHMLTWLGSLQLDLIKKIR